MLSLRLRKVRVRLSVAECSYWLRCSCFSEGASEVCCYRTCIDDGFRVLKAVQMKNSGLSSVAVTQKREAGENQEVFRLAVSYIGIVVEVMAR